MKILLCYHSGKRRSLLPVLVLVTCLIVTCNPKQPPAEQEHSAKDQNPNVILILADDMGFGDLSCYGQKVLSTPHIDQMAEEGIKFHNHYTGSTVCAPSRASLLTGLHTGHVSVRGNQPDQLLTEELTVGKLMQQAGYRTAIIGKWGVGHPPAPDDPKRNGFDHAYGYINMWHAHNFYPEFLYRNGEVDSIAGNKLTRNPDGSRKWAEDKPEGTGVAEVKAQHTHELFEQDALQFIEDNQDGPFFLYLALNMPHANNEHPTDGMEVPGYGQFANRDWPEPEKGFAMMIQMIDETVGRINQRLQQLGIDENTLVVFASDNGPHQEGHHKMEFFDSNGILRGMKRDFYEGGVRTPFIAKWPTKIAPGSQSEHVSAFWDFLPTMAELTAVELNQPVDGVSYLPTLLGQTNRQEVHRYLYWEFYEQGGKQAVLKDRYKAVRLDVRTGNPQSTQLYDINQDPGEDNNIAAEYPEVVTELEKYMDDAHQPLEFMSLFKMDVSADTPY